MVTRLDCAEPHLPIAQDDSKCTIRRELEVQETEERESCGRLRWW